MGITITIGSRSPCWSFPSHDHDAMFFLPHLPVPYLEPGVDRYLIYWQLGAKGSKNIGNWKMRVLDDMKPEMLEF